ncbi:hypothetical protein imdm_927 [gamma proteobacterium IMCC2047]|nr:hypothetical protein imdm_927 [gamma proteobacterium IMCC2047]
MGGKATVKTKDEQLHPVEITAHIKLLQVVNSFNNNALPVIYLQ